MPIVEHENLPNKPLVEAILEIKWGQPNEPDSAYPVMVGRLYERVRDKYPAIEDLPITQIPPNMTVHVVRHRFRAADGQWPLVQIGPGVVALNDTENYTWPDFRARAMELHPQVKESHPNPGALQITSLKLQYIDAVEFDYNKADVRQFLKDKMHIALSVPNVLFEGKPITDQPTNTVVVLEFATGEPRGRAQLRVSTGKKNDMPAIVWHTSLWSDQGDAARAWADLEPWLEGAHSILHHWFFALIQGDLLEEFSRE